MIVPVEIIEIQTYQVQALIVKGEGGGSRPFFESLFKFYEKFLWTRLKLTDLVVSVIIQVMLGGNWARIADFFNPHPELNSEFLPANGNVYIYLEISSPRFSTEFPSFR